MTNISNFRFILDTYSAKEKVQLLKELYQDIAGYGINGDEKLAHVNSLEASILKSLGGSGTINDVTGLPQYFGGGDRPETHEEQRARLPAEIAPYVTDILGESRRLYGEAGKEGYVDEPETVAAPAERELAAREGLVDLMGTQRPYLERGLASYIGGEEKATTPALQQYMSPYQQAVTDMDKAKAQEDFEASRKGFEARGVQAGGMSGLGSRMAVESGLREQSHLANLAGIQARGSQKSFEDARKAFEQQKARERQAGTDIIGVGKDIYGTGVAEQGLMAQVGEAERADTQQQLDDLYRRFIQKQDFPETELAKYSGFVYGNPYLRGASDAQIKRVGPKGPSFGQQILSGGIQAAGQFAGGYGRGMGGSAAGGRLSNYKARHGGGLRDIMYDRYVNRKGGGSTSLPVVYRREGDSIGDRFSDIDLEDRFSDIRTEAERKKLHETREKERAALAESQERSAWGDALASLGAVVEGVGAQYGTTAVVGPGGMPYYPSTGQQVMSKRFEELHKERGASRAAKKKREKEALEAGYKLEDEIAGIPEELRKRIRDLDLLDITKREKEARTENLLRQYGSKRRKTMYKSPTKKQLGAAREEWLNNFQISLPKLTSNQNKIFAKAVQRLSDNDKDIIIRQQQQYMHANDQLAPRVALLKAIVKFRRENPKELDLSRGERGITTSSGPWGVWDKLGRLVD